MFPAGKNLTKNDKNQADKAKEELIKENDMVIALNFAKDSVVKIVRHVSNILTISSED